MLTYAFWSVILKIKASTFVQMDGLSSRDKRTAKNLRTSQINKKQKKLSSPFRMLLNKKPLVDSRDKKD